jgi:hypothetical protein
MSGWVKLERSFLESDLWTSEPFTKAQAWIDLFGLANHERRTVWIRGVALTVERGQTARSELSLAKKWIWSRKKVRAFLKTLERLHQIGQQKSNITTLITILNYDKYQGQDTPKGTTEDTPKEHQKNTKGYTNKNDKNYKNDKNIKKEKEKKTKKPVFSPPTIEQTIQFFTENGYTEVSARKAHAFYEDGEWFDSRGNKVMNWKQKMRGVWFKEENRAVNDKHNNFKEKEYVGTPHDQISWMQD